MKKALLTASALIIILCSLAQAPGIRSEKYVTLYSYATGQVILDAKKTADGGYIVVGSDSAYDMRDSLLASKSAYADRWIAKIDSIGTVQWSHSFRDVGIHDYGASVYTSVILTSEGGYLAAGYVPTNAFDRSTNNFVVTKFGSDGSILWDKTYGGSGIDRAYSVVQASNGNYVVAGVTNSNDADVSGNHGLEDIWLISLNGAGNLLWQKCIGGTGSEIAYDLTETNDGGLLLVGITGLVSSDLNGNFGNSDAWVVKTDLFGSILWQRSYGGAGDEGFKDVVINSDSTFTAVGFTSSAAVAGYSSKGGRDVWIVKANLSNGNVVWSNGYGGSQNDEGISVDRTVGNGYLIAGYTRSINGDISFNHGDADAWLLKISSDGNLIWEKTAGTSLFDGATVAIYKTETDYALFGTGKALPWNYFGGYFVRFGNANRIKGTVYFDANSNGIKDAGEDYYSKVVVKTNGAVDRASVPVNGLFQMDVGLGSYTTTVQVPSPYFTIVPASVTSPNYTTYFNTDSVSFAVQPIPNVQDLSISLFSTSIARPGFTVIYKILYQNVGTAAIGSGEVLLKKDSRLNFISANPAIASSNGDTLKWKYSNLVPGDTSAIIISLSVQAPPAVNIGDWLTSKAIINPVAADVTPADDTALLKQPVFGSYDPNDKRETNGEIKSSFGLSGNYLQYVVRFQNTGTDTAFNIFIRDTLSSRLNWNTFQMVSSSHPYTLLINNDNEVEWTFSNIQLPDSNVNEPASHGYIVYRIQPVPSLIDGETLHNTASIYFDYNLPVLTNDATTLVQDNFTSLPIQLINFTGQLSNNTVQLNWKADQGKDFEKFEIERSLDGKIYSRIETVPFNNSISDYHLLDNISALQSKLIFYRLKMIDADSKFSYSKVIVFRTNPVQNNFTIYPNPARTEIFVSLIADKKQNLRVKVLDASGRILSEHQKEVQKGTNVFPVNTFGLKAGNYILQMILNGEMKASKFAIIN